MVRLSCYAHVVDLWSPCDFKTSVQFVDPAPAHPHPHAHISRFLPVILELSGFKNAAYTLSKTVRARVRAVEVCVAIGDCVFIFSPHSCTVLQLATCTPGVTCVTVA